MPSNDHATDRVAHARAVMRDRYREEASAQLAVMGIDPTPDQLAEAGDRLLKQAQRDRLNVARLTRWTAHEAEKRDADKMWGARQALHFAETITAYSPVTMTRAAVYRIVFMALQDELVAPDGFSRPRCLKRLQNLYDSVRADSQKRSDRLDATLLPTERLREDSLPSLDLGEDLDEHDVE